MKRSFQGFGEFAQSICENDEGQTEVNIANAISIAKAFVREYKAYGWCKATRIAKHSMIDAGMPRITARRVYKYLRNVSTDRYFIFRFANKEFCGFIESL